MADNDESPSVSFDKRTAGRTDAIWGAVNVKVVLPYVMPAAPLILSFVRNNVHTVHGYCVIRKALLLVPTVTYHFFKSFPYHTAAASSHPAAPASNGSQSRRSR